MKRILLLLAALGTGVGAFFLVRAARDPGVTHPSGGGDAAAAARPDPGLTHPDTGLTTHPDTGLTHPDTGLTHPDGGRTGPILPTPPLPGGSGSDVAVAPPGGRSFAFDDEPRDPAWAEEHEREMTLRMRRLLDDLTRRGSIVDVDAIECRRSLCRVSLRAKDVPALSALYGAIESEQGLYGWADNVLLASVEAADDGGVKTSVTAVFHRDQGP